MSQWHSCAICLEEYPEHQLLTHKVCGGVLCHACMEVRIGQLGLLLGTLFFIVEFLSSVL